MSFFAEVTLVQVAVLWLWAIAACAPWHRFSSGHWLRAALHLKYAAWLIGVYWLCAFFVHEYAAVVVAGAVALSIFELAPEKERRALSPPIQEFIFSNRPTPIERASRLSGESRRAIDGPGEDSRRSP